MVVDLWTRDLAQMRQTTPLNGIKESIIEVSVLVLFGVGNRYCTEAFVQERSVSRTFRGGPRCGPLSQSSYREGPNPADAAEPERASLSTLFLPASSTLFRLSCISLRSVRTCLLMACHTGLDSRSSELDIAGPASGGLLMIGPSAL